MDCPFGDDTDCYFMFIDVRNSTIGDLECAASISYNNGSVWPQSTPGTMTIAPNSAYPIITLNRGAKLKPAWQIDCNALAPPGPPHPEVNTDGSGAGSSSSAPVATGGSLSIDFLGVIMCSDGYGANPHVEITNSTNANVTNRLRYERWLTEDKYAGGDLKGYKVAESQIIDGIPAQTIITLSGWLPRGNFPPPGQYYTVNLLAEESAGCNAFDGFCIADYDDFVAQTGSGAEPVPDGGPAGLGHYALDIDPAFSSYSYSLSDNLSQATFVYPELTNWQQCFDNYYTGTLRLELLISPEKLVWPPVETKRLASMHLDGLNIGEAHPAGEKTVPTIFIPSKGDYFAYIVISNYSPGTAHCQGGKLSDDFCPLGVVNAWPLSISASGSDKPFDPDPDPGAGASAGDGGGGSSVSLPVTLLLLLLTRVRRRYLRY